MFIAGTPGYQHQFPGSGYLEGWRGPGGYLPTLTKIIQPLVKGADSKILRVPTQPQSIL